MKELLHITRNHNEKMKGIVSLSTSAKVNPICQKRALDEKSICFKCYALRMLKRFSNLDKVLIKNAEILTSRLLTLDEIKSLNINCLYFRFESFGDLINDIQALNYLNIAKHYKATNFALWTKNPLILASALKQFNKDMIKPKNLYIVLSNPILNTSIENSFKFVDKVFNVYDSATIEKENININCKKECFNCLLCYKKNNVKVINERLK